MPGTYHEVASHPARILVDSLTAPINGLYGIEDAKGKINYYNSGGLFGAIDIALFILVIGGFLGVTMKTGADEGPVDADEVLALPETAESKLGEIYELGAHRLLCGDATDPRAVAELMRGGRAERHATDPPYGVGVDHSWRRGLRRGMLARNDRERRPGRLGCCLRARRTLRSPTSGTAPCMRLKHGTDWSAAASRSPANHLGQGRARLRPGRLPVAARALLVCRARAGKGASWERGRAQSTVWEAASPIAHAADRLVTEAGGGRRVVNRLRLRLQTR